MKITNLDYIKKLSQMDIKNLHEKLIKLFEEGGELSSKILPFLNAKCTKHKITTREQILEEVADVLLVARSIGYSLNFSHEEIEEKMMEKSLYWANLQKREARMANELPFEIHITVAEADKNSFIDACKLLEVKPVILHLQASNSIITDVMTSSVFMGNNNGALNEMKRISSGLESHGFKVVREKIETVPWHTAAPSSEFDNLIMPKSCYFETHFAIEMNSNDKKENFLQFVCDNNNCHLSKNAFKVYEGGNYVVMATYRSYDSTYESFLTEIEKITLNFKESGFLLGKTIIEFSLYDSKVNHDSEWLKK